MKADDPKITWIEEPKLGLSGRMYLPLFVQGLSTTFELKQAGGSTTNCSTILARIAASTSGRTTRAWALQFTVILGSSGFILPSLLCVERICDWLRTVIARQRRHHTGNNPRGQRHAPTDDDGSNKLSSRCRGQRFSVFDQHRRQHQIHQSQRHHHFPG